MTPTIGSKFTLTELPEIVWEVVSIYNYAFFKAIPSNETESFERPIIYLNVKHASKLNWIKPEVKLSKEQANKVKEFLNKYNEDGDYYINDVHKDIDKITE